MEKTTVGLLVATLVAVLFFGFSSLKVIFAPVVDNQQPVGQVSTGDGYVITKNLAYTQLTTSGVAITNAAQGGKLIVENIIVETDTVGMASGTLFQIEVQGDDYASGTVMSVPVTALGADKVSDMKQYMINPSATTSPSFVLSDGAKLVAKCTTAACRGTNSVTGYVNITMQLKKADRQAYIYE